MSKNWVNRNEPPAEDVAIADEFKQAADALAEIMTRLRKQGLEASFAGIRPSAKNPNVYEVVDLTVKKIIL